MSINSIALLKLPPPPIPQNPWLQVSWTKPTVGWTTPLTVILTDQSPEVLQLHLQVTLTVHGHLCRGKLWRRRQAREWHPLPSRGKTAASVVPASPWMLSLPAKRQVSFFFKLHSAALTRDYLSVKTKEEEEQQQNNNPTKQPTHNLFWNFSSPITISMLVSLL